MTREQAIQKLQYTKDCVTDIDDREALSMAIEALKAESTMGQLKVDVSINKPTERWDTCGLSENDILVDSEQEEKGEKMAETIEIIYEQRHMADGVFYIVPVQRLVRCRDCKYNLKGYCDNRLGLPWRTITPDDFCSRRGNKNDERRSDKKGTR